MKQTKECFDFEGIRLCKICGCVGKSCKCELVEEKNEQRTI